MPSQFRNVFFLSGSIISVYIQFSFFPPLILWCCMSFKCLAYCVVDALTVACHGQLFSIFSQFMDFFLSSVKSFFVEWQQVYVSINELYVSISERHISKKTLQILWFFGSGNKFPVTSMASPDRGDLLRLVSNIRHKFSLIECVLSLIW